LYETSVFITVFTTFYHWTLSLPRNEKLKLVHEKPLEMKVKVEQPLYRPVTGSEGCSRFRLPDFKTVGT
jgi:hypothetical protein